ncbi:MAG: hypothetical protein ACUVUF_03935 [Candidatus Bathycorpusculaceae bacterium]
MSKRKLTHIEIKILQEAINSDYKDGNIRLREGEYQYDLAKAIAHFQLELHFPDVKDIIERFYGKDKVNDIQFVRKIQTILKKMEKSDIVKILPKSRPWELQRYALTSFKFRDSDKNLVTFATEEQIQESQNLLHSMFDQQQISPVGKNYVNIKICFLTILIIASYLLILLDFLQSRINPAIFIPAFSIAVVCSMLVGKILSRK